MDIGLDTDLIAPAELLSSRFISPASLNDRHIQQYEEEEEAFLLFANHLHSFLRYCVALHTLCICDPTLRCQ